MYGIGRGLQLKVSVDREGNIDLQDNKRCKGELHSVITKVIHPDCHDYQTPSHMLTYFPHIL